MIKLNECPLCGSRKIKQRQGNYPTIDRDDNEINIPAITYDICLDCGESFLDSNNMRKIENYLGLKKEDKILV